MSVKRKLGFVRTEKLVFVGVPCEEEGFRLVVAIPRDAEDDIGG